MLDRHMYVCVRYMYVVCVCVTWKISPRKICLWEGGWRLGWEGDGCEKRQWSGYCSSQSQTKGKGDIGGAASGGCCLQASVCFAEPGRKKQAVNSSLCCLLLLHHTTCNVTVIASAWELTVSLDLMAKIKNKISQSKWTQSTPLFL